VARFAETCITAIPNRAREICRSARVSLLKQPSLFHFIPKTKQVQTSQKYHTQRLLSLEAKAARLASVPTTTMTDSHYTMATAAKNHEFYQGPTTAETQQHDNSLNAKDSDGRTALMCASLKGDLPMVQYLVETQHAPVDATDSDGWTALIHASSNGHLPVVHYLVEHGKANANVASKNGTTALSVASQHGFWSVMKYLISVGHVNIKATETGAKALQVASYFGNMSVVQFWVEHSDRVNLEATNIFGETALFITCKSGHLNVVKYLIEKGKANVEATNWNGWTPLHIACWYNHFAIVQCLIDSGHANVHAVTHNEESPLHFLLANVKHLRCVLYIVQRFIYIHTP
jgi:ankyrin repeat protein